MAAKKEQPGTSSSFSSTFGPSSNLEDSLRILEQEEPQLQRIRRLLRDNGFKIVPTTDHNFIPNGYFQNSVAQSEITSLQEAVQRLEAQLLETDTKLQDTEMSWKQLKQEETRKVNELEKKLQEERTNSRNSIVSLSDERDRFQSDQFRFKAFVRKLKHVCMLEDNREDNDLISNSFLETITSHIGTLTSKKTGMPTRELNKLKDLVIPLAAYFHCDNSTNETQDNSQPQPGPSNATAQFNQPTSSSMSPIPSSSTGDNSADNIIDDLIRVPLAAKKRGRARGVERLEKSNILKIKRITGLKAFDCKMCKKTLATFGNLKKHLEMKHESKLLKDFKAGCKLCGKMFKREEKLLEHCKDFHVNEAEASAASTASTSAADRR